MSYMFVERGWGMLVLATLAACSELRSQGEQCVFNDDCVAPLVCAGHRCRAECRSARDCAAGMVCAPSENPQKQVCIPASGPSLCAVESQCPAGSSCRADACWWTCRDDAACAARAAGVCLRPAALCATPVSAREQIDLASAPPADGGADAAVPPRDLGADLGADASPPDAAADAPPGPSDAAPFDAPTCRADGDCRFANAAGLCRGGRCAMGACAAGFGDCDGAPDNGCEVALARDVSHCGRCGARCLQAPGVMQVGCAAGACQIDACAAGSADCDGNTDNGCEANIQTSREHCGACGAACAAPPGVQASVCTAGRCGYTMCRPGMGDCDNLASNGCETDLLTSVNHCGACRAACARGVGGTATCATGLCSLTCSAGRANCNGDVADGCETTLAIDPDHCRACGARCAGDAVCSATGCVTSRYAAGDTTVDFAPTVDTVLPSGVHRFRSVRVPAGVTVRTTAPGVLELLVRGEIRVEGTIDVSGGAGGAGSAPNATDCAGGNGGGGATGSGVVGAAGTTSCRGPGGSGLGLAGGAGSYADASCGVGGSFGGGAGGSPAPCGALCGGGGGGGGGYGGGGGGGGFGNASNGGTGGSEMTVTFAGAQAGGPGGAGGPGAYGGRPGLPGGLGGLSNGGGGGGGGAIGALAGADLRMGTTFRPGSGGGGGGAYGFAMSTSRCATVGIGGGAGGGGGGGALRLASATRIVVSAGGRILANGGSGGASTVVDAARSICHGAGGGGSGGAIHLFAPALEMLGTVSAVGGPGGTSPVVNRCAGGAGGVGRIHVVTRHASCLAGGTWSPNWNGAACVAHADAAGSLTSAEFP